MTLSPAMNFGVQSYCFRHFKDNVDVANKVKQIGLDKIEVCAVHADFNDLPAWKKIVKTYSDQGVTINSIGVQTFTGDPKERDWFECAAAASAKHISAHFTVDRFATAVPATAKLCDEFNIRIGIHCHGGYQFGGSPDVLQHLLDLGGPSIGICLDTAWCMQLGPAAGNPIQWVGELFPGRIYGVHYKDFVFEKNAQCNDVIVGTGNLDLPALIGALDDTDFDGMAVIEYEADVQNPVPALTQCVNQMRNVSITT